LNTSRAARRRTSAVSTPAMPLYIKILPLLLSRFGQPLGIERPVQIIVAVDEADELVGGCGVRAKDHRDALRSRLLNCPFTAAPSGVTTRTSGLRVSRSSMSLTCLSPLPLASRVEEVAQHVLVFVPQLVLEGGIVQAGPRVGWALGRVRHLVRRSLLVLRGVDQRDFCRTQPSAVARSPAGRTSVPQRRTPAPALRAAWMPRRPRRLVTPRRRARASSRGG